MLPFYKYLNLSDVIRLDCKNLPGKMFCRAFFKSIVTAGVREYEKIICTRFIVLVGSFLVPESSNNKIAGASGFDVGQERSNPDH
jgi:hypothetical protein